METDANVQRPLPTDDIYQEKSTQDRADEFDDTKNSGCKELLVVTSRAKQCKELRGINRDAVSYSVYVSIVVKVEFGVDGTCERTDLLRHTS